MVTGGAMIALEGQSGLGVTETTASITQREIAVWITYDFPGALLFILQNPASESHSLKTFSEVSPPLTSPQRSMAPVILPPASAVTGTTGAGAVLLYAGHRGVHLWCILFTEAPHHSSRRRKVGTLSPRFTNREPEGRRGSSGFFLGTQFELVSAFSI